tara:strand:+ start:418 stop:654 length:237 start_codon:yes stop_codon:yes gene_type:complete
MTDIQEKPTLVFNDQTYVIEDLSDNAKYLVGQIQDLMQQKTATQARLDQVEVARRGFEGLLQTELEKPPEEVAEPVED